MKRTVSFLALVVMLVSAVTVALAANVHPADRNSEYCVGFASADNTIVLSGVESAGTYTLRYANTDGALAHYADICSLEVTDPAISVSYDDLIVENCAPAEATTIAVYNADNEKVGDIALGSLANHPGEKLYSFGVLADIHINSENASYFVSAAQNALDYLTETANVQFTCIPGDLTQNGNQQELSMLKNIIDTYAPVYVSRGNHDTAAYSGTVWTEEMVNEYMGHGTYYSFEHHNDVFIMLGMTRVTTSDLFEDEVLSWLANTLETNKDKRCFLFFHVYPNHSCGDPYNAYGGDLISGEEETFFDELLSHYPNVTWFHGHSHFVFDVQADAESATVDTSGPFNSIHIPSLSQPKVLRKNDDGSYDYAFRETTAEGYVVEVYENGIVLRGIDFRSEKYFPIANYYIDTSIEKTAPGTFRDSVGILNSEHVEHVWLYETGSDKNTGAIGEVGGNTTYSVTEPVFLDSSYKYKVWAGDQFAYPSYILYYDSNNTFLGREDFVKMGTVRSGGLILEPPEGASCFRIRVYSGQNYAATTDLFVVSRQKQSKAD